MRLIEHVRACNARDPARFRPLRIAGRPVGRLRDDLADLLAGAPELRVAPDGADLVPDAETFEGRSAALARLARRIVEAGRVEGLRGEDYPVVERWGDAPLARVDRAAVPPLGLLAFGVHVNGLVRGAGGPRVWVGRRAKDRGVAPGKLDNMVAGGQPLGLSLAENLRKEGAEEAGLPAETMDRAVPVGVVSYAMEEPAGLRRDVLFLYDLWLDEGVVPRNADGEVEAFELWPAARVLETVRAGFDFKFNVALVAIDMAVRHGLVGPDEPDYPELCAGLAGPTG